MSNKQETFEMLWDCRMCGTKKLLGKRNRFCPNCGAAQDPEWRYFPAESDMVFIENPVFDGADKICPACSTPNSAKSAFCMQCGADLINAKEASGQAALDTGFDGAAGVRDDLVKKKWEAEQLSIKNANKKQSRILGLPTWLFGLLAVILIGGALFAFLSNSRDRVSLTVAGLDWKRTINVEEFAARTSGSWQSGVPSDAYNKSCSSKIKGYNKVPDGQQQVCHNKSVRVACGYTYTDKKDGSGSRQTKYCTESKQVCGMETRYRDVPYFDTWCSYMVDRWGPDDPVIASGKAETPPQWPQFSSSASQTIGAKREAKRVEDYLVTFAKPDKSTLQYTPKTEPEYTGFQLGKAYQVDQNKLGTVYWETLKSNAQ